MNNIISPFYMRRSPAAMLVTRLHLELGYYPIDTPSPFEYYAEETFRIYQLPQIFYHYKGDFYNLSNSAKIQMPDVEADLSDRYFAYYPLEDFWGQFVSCCLNPFKHALQNIEEKNFKAASARSQRYLLQKKHTKHQPLPEEKVLR